jgi:hypothetical protein
MNIKRSTGALNVIPTVGESSVCLIWEHSLVEYHNVFAVSDEIMLYSRFFILFLISKLIT